MKVENEKISRMNVEESTWAFVSLLIKNISKFCLIFSECGNCKHPYFIGEVRIFSLRCSWVKSTKSHLILGPCTQQKQAVRTHQERSTSPTFLPMFFEIGTDPSFFPMSVKPTNNNNNLSPEQFLDSYITVRYGFEHALSQYRSLIVKIGPLPRRCFVTSTQPSKLGP